MIRVALECALLFMLPSLLYVGYKFLIGELEHPATGHTKSVAEILDEAPLVWLFAAGCVLLLGALLTFATLQDQNIDKPYKPAIYKDGHIEQGR